MLDNSRALLGMVQLFSGVLGAAMASGARVRGSIVTLALWVLVLEGMQCWVDGRSGDITSVVLVLVVGGGLTLLVGRNTDVTSTLNDVSPWRESAPDVDRRASMSAQPSATLRQARRPGHPFWAAAAAVAMIVTVVSAGLRQPGLPYNVVELFRADGHPAILAVFALALLALGAGPGWLGRSLSTTRWPLLCLPVGAMACAWATLALVWSSATDESVGDVAGSTNLVWFVTNKDLWGPLWRQIFIAINMPESISFLERCVRWAALYCPLPLVLASLVAAYERRRVGLPLDAQWIAGLLVGGGLMMWLCKAIAFDWSSTDNLNELIMPDGTWGWGGGGWLYALLLLFCVSAWALATGASSGWFWMVGALAGCALALPLGWWLVNQALNPAVEKYGQVFSGAQFLLGPDRRHLLLPEVLMLRWFVVQAGGVLVMAIGLWLVQRMETWRALRRLRAC